MMIFDILTIFPQLLDSPMQEGIIRQARIKKQIDIRITDIRKYAHDKHKMTDDRPFGGGEGMVMKPEPLAEATQVVSSKDTHVILLSPQGNKLDQPKVKQLADKPHLVLVCGRYEGVDSRYIENYVDEEISIGDYILSGGELGAMVIVDAVTRVIPGVLGCSDSVCKDTFARNLLKHQQYTRPRCFENKDIPEILLSGDHQKIEDHRFVDTIRVTLAKRPDLVADVAFSKKEIKLLKKYKLYDNILELCQKKDSP